MYQICVPDSAQCMPMLKVQKNEAAKGRNGQEDSFWDAEAARFWSWRCINDWAHGCWDANEMTWKNPRTAEWINQWTDESTSISQWHDEAANWRRNEAVNQWTRWWITQSMKQGSCESLMSRSNEPMNEWSSDSMNQWINESMKQPVTESMSQWMNQSVNQWICESFLQWSNESVNQRINDSVTKRMKTMKKWWTERWVDGWIDEQATFLCWAELLLHWATSSLRHFAEAPLFSATSSLTMLWA